jgi:hypothetical protein
MDLRLVLDTIDVTAKLMRDEAEAAASWAYAHRSELEAMGGTKYFAGVAAGTKTAIEDFTASLKQALLFANALDKGEQ